MTYRADTKSMAYHCRKKGRVVFLVYDMLSHPFLHFCQVPSKYSEGYTSYRADPKFFSNKTKGDNSKSKKAWVVNLVWNTTSSRPDLNFYQVSSKYSKGFSSDRADIPKGFQVTERTWLREGVGWEGGGGGDTHNFQRTQMSFPAPLPPPWPLFHTHTLQHSHPLTPTLLQHSKLGWSGKQGQGYQNLSNSSQCPRDTSISTQVWRKFINWLR